MQGKATTALHCSDGESAAESLQVAQNHGKAAALGNALVVSMAVPWFLCFVLYTGASLAWCMVSSQHTGSCGAAKDAKGGRAKLDLCLSQQRAAAGINGLAGVNSSMWWSMLYSSTSILLSYQAAAALCCVSSRRGQQHDASWAQACTGPTPKTSEPLWQRQQLPRMRTPPPPVGRALTKLSWHPALCCVWTLRAMFC